MRTLGLCGWLCGAVLLSSLAARAQDSGAEAEAGDVSEVDKDRLGPLRERIRPVSGHLLLKQGRFEVSPAVTLSVKDSFFTKYVVGGSLTFHPLETIGISARFGYSIPVVSGAAQICTTGEGSRGCRLPTFAELDGKAPGQIRLLAGGDVQWAPIYGKISLVAEKFLHFDMYGLGGASMVQFVGPTGSATTFGGNVGLGMRFFINRWMTFRTELRDLVYLENFQVNNSIRNQIMVEFGLSMFFPTTFDSEG